MLYASGGPSTITLSQTTTVVPGTYYSLYVNLGVARSNTIACPITVTVVGTASESSLTLSSSFLSSPKPQPLNSSLVFNPVHTLPVITDLCSDATQCTSSGTGLWQTFVLDPILLQGSSSATVSISWDCSGVGGDTSSYYYMADDLVLTESA